MQSPRARWLPFGTRDTAGIAGTLPTDFGFTGQRNKGFGLYDYNARYYDPLLARFVSADTIVPDPANPQSFNRYAYVYNNALRYTDPSGRGLFSDVLMALGNSGSLGTKLVVAMADVVHHVNGQTHKVFWTAATTSAWADGKCTNEAQMALDAGTKFKWTLQRAQLVSFRNTGKCLAL